MAVRYSTTTEKSVIRIFKNLEKVIYPLSDREAINLARKLESRLSIPALPGLEVSESWIVKLINIEDIETIVEEELIQVKSDLLPQSQFNWMKDNLRAQIVTLRLLRIKINDKGYKSDESYYGRLTMNRIYSIFDTMEKETDLCFRTSQYTDTPEQFQIVTIDEQEELLRNIQDAANQILEQDNYTKWLNTEDIPQIEWVKRYLINHREYSRIHIDENDLDLVMHKLLASLDLIDIQIGNAFNRRDEYCIPASKELFIDKMKRAWSQQKFRNAGKTKKPYHLPLTFKSQKRLEKMAKIKGLSTTAMLDIIINSRYELDFLDIDGNELFKD